MKKFIAVVLLLIIFLVLCTGCSNTATDGGVKKVITAKVRYFDGSMDTLELERFYYSASGVTLFLKNGTEMTLGINNVIIIKEPEEQYGH